MLGPELLNLSVRPTPIFLEGTAAIRIDEPGPRQLGLTNFQVVQGLVAMERGQLYLTLSGTSHSIYAPDILRRYLGSECVLQGTDHARWCRGAKALPRLPPLRPRSSLR
jgi:hypothetical protein